MPNRKKLVIRSNFLVMLKYVFGAKKYCISMLDSSNAYFSLNILGKKVLVKEIAYYLFDKKHVGRNRMLTLGHLLAGCKIEI